MGKTNGRLRAATGVLVLAAAVAALPGTSTAAPPAKSSGYSCTTSAKAPAGSTKVMIAGDSITNGSAGDYTWPYWLWRDQVGRGAKIDYVGDWRGTYDIQARVYDSRAYNDCGFDQDKESRSGVKLWTAGTGRFGLGSKTQPTNDPSNPNYPGQTSWIRGATNRFKPSILVLFAGANDLSSTSGEPIPDKSEAGIANFVISRLKLVISQARAGSPGIDIVLTTVPAVGAKSSRYNQYNAKLPGVVRALSTPQQKLVLAKIPSWTNHSWDGLHPDAIGEVAIAASIDDALHQISPKLLARPKTLAKPAVGPRFPAELSGSASGNSVTLTWKFPPGADRTVIYLRKDGGSWVKRADLVKESLRTFYPQDGTETCASPCESYKVTGLSQGSTYDFLVKIGKGHALSGLRSNELTFRIASILG